MPVSLPGTSTFCNSRAASSKMLVIRSKIRDLDRVSRRVEAVGRGEGPLRFARQELEA